MTLLSRRVRIGALLHVAVLLSVGAARSEEESGPPSEPSAPAEATPTSPSMFGLLLGIRAGAVIPAAGGGTIRGPKYIGIFTLPNDGATKGLGDYVTAGAGAGFDAYFRVARMLLVGGTFEAAALTSPSQQVSDPNISSGRPFTVTSSATTTYVGALLGIIPDVDQLSFIGDLGVGARRINRALNIDDHDPLSADSHVTGLEVTAGVGLSIPVKAFRIVPRLNANIGSFTTVQSNDETPRDIASADRATHVLLFAGVAAYYSLDFGERRKP